MTTTADEICETFGFTVEEAEEAAERVEKLKERIDGHREIPTTIELADGSRIHRHQLVAGPDDREYVVTDMGRETITLVEIEPPAPDEDGHGLTDVGFLGKTTTTHGDIIMHYEPQITPDGTPIWGY